jgi:hypothetical protein
VLEPKGSAPPVSALAICLLLLLIGCRALQPAPRGLLQRIAEIDASRSPTFRRQGEVRIESSKVSGTFTALLVAQRGDAPRARLQLLPDLGGKVLDLAISECRIAGYFPQAREGVDVPLEDAERAPRHLLVFMAITLLEELTPLSPRVLGAERRGELFALTLAPALEGASVEALVDKDGFVSERRYRFRHVGWTETRLGGGAEAREVVLEGEDFLLVVRPGASDPADDLDDSLFKLELPSGVDR